MHYARPLLDRRGRLAFVAASIGIAAAAVSCGGGNTPNAPIDAPDGDAAPEATQTNDAGLEDVVQDKHVEPFDGGLHLSCARRILARRSS